MSNNEMSFIQAVRQRRAVRRFLPQALTQEQLIEVLEDAQWSPSNCNTQYGRSISFQENQNELSACCLQMKNRATSLPISGLISRLTRVSIQNAYIIWENPAMKRWESPVKIKQPDGIIRAEISVLWCTSCGAFIYAPFW